jgi:hypothetical protein
MSRIIEVTAFKFHELPEDIQEKLIEKEANERASFVNPWQYEWNDSYKAAHAFAKQFTDVQLQFSGKRLVKLIFQHKKTLLNGNCSFTGYCGDESFCDVFRDYLKNWSQKDNATLEDLCDSGLQQIQYDSEKDFDYYTSKKAILEDIADGILFADQEFDINGRQL